MNVNNRTPHHTPFITFNILIECDYSDHKSDADSIGGDILENVIIQEIGNVENNNNNPDFEKQSRVTAEQEGEESENEASCEGVTNKLTNEFK